MTTTNGHERPWTTIEEQQRIPTLAYHMDSALTETGDAIRALGYLDQAIAAIPNSVGGKLRADSKALLAGAKALRLKLVREIAAQEW